MIECFNILSTIRARTSQASFHVVAAEHVRIEFRNLNVGDTVGPFTYGGDVIVTCYRGEAELTADADAVHLTEYDQAVVPHGKLTSIACQSSATVQIIWSPAHAATTI
jgi:hypothetical protein